MAEGKVYINSGYDRDLFFKETFNLYFERIVAYIYGYCRDSEVAKNIAQDTFITFWENIEKVNSEKTPLPYLLFIAKNKAINAIKRELVKGKFNDYTQKRDLELSYRAFGSETIDSITANEIESIVNKSVGQMKENVQQTFCLSRFKNLKNEEVAKELDVSVKTVEYRLASALRVLRRNLKDFIQIIILLFLI